MPLAVGTVSGYNESDYAERISIMINGEKFRRRKLALGILLTLFAVFLQSISFGLSVQAKEEKGRTIRVAYPIQGGLTEKDKQGITAAIPMIIFRRLRSIPDGTMNLSRLKET